MLKIVLLLGDKITYCTKHFCVKLISDFMVSLDHITKKIIHSSNNA